MSFNLRFIRGEFIQFLIISCGALPGAVIRWQLSNDLLVNCVGTGLLGLLMGLKVSSKIQLLIGFGFCGALTTFSAWMVSCIQLIAKGLWLQLFELILFPLMMGLLWAGLGFAVGLQFKNLKLAQSLPLVLKHLGRRHF